MGMKEYVRPQDGYRIRVSEKAYRLFYQKQGFVPVSQSDSRTKAVVPEADKDAGAEHGAGEAAKQAEAVPKKKKTKKAPEEEKAPSGEQ